MSGIWNPVVKDGVVNDRKWELKCNNIVLATIYHQARDSRYSLWVSSPFIFREISTVGCKTYIFDTFEETKQAFNDLCQEKVLPWCREMIAHFARS